MAASVGDDSVVMTQRGGFDIMLSNAALLLVASENTPETWDTLSMINHGKNSSQIQFVYLSWNSPSLQMLC